MPQQPIFPKQFPPWQSSIRATENLKLANEFATPGTVKHFMIRSGYLPDNEQRTEETIIRLLQERDWLEEQLQEIQR